MSKDLTSERAGADGQVSRERLEHAYLAQILVRQVLSAHVRGAIDTSNALATSVIHEAEATHHASSELSAFVEMSAQSADQVLSRVSAAIESAHVLERDVLQEQSRRLEQASAESRDMLREQRRLERIAESAQDVGRRIRIVAMNTTIQSMQSKDSENNRVIAVLAREISSLAGDVQNLGLELADSLGRLSSAVDRNMVTGVASAAETMSEVRGSLAQQIDKLRGSYEQLERFRHTVLRRVVETSEGVRTHAYNTLGSIQSQDILRQRLEQVLQVLATMAEKDVQLRAALLGEAPLPADWAPVCAEQLESQYVMETQRRAHAQETHSAGSGEDAGGGPAIELF